MARNPHALALLLLFLPVFLGMVATNASADSAGELPDAEDGDVPPSLPPDSISGDVIGDDEALSPDSSADGAKLAPSVVAAGLGPSTGEDETTTASSTKGGTPADEKSSSGTSATAELTSVAAASTTFLTATAAVLWF